MDYKVDLRDVKFQLFEWLPTAKLLEAEKFADWDVENIEMVLDEAVKIAQEQFAPCNEAGDRIGAQWSDGKVTLPEGFHTAYQTVTEGGWIGLLANPEYGGMGLPELLGTAVNEFFNGSNVAFSLTLMLTRGVGHMIEGFGTGEQKQLYVEKVLSGQWAGTMCLTEAQAGSDVGASKTKAARNEDGSYQITGEKIFITGGEHDLTENIVHMVLARLPDAPSGSRGISLFLVPKRLPGPDGAPGAANGVGCTSLEHKLGIHGSATCVMDFDGSRGWLVGEPNGGLKCMFTMMNHARLWVGLQGLAQCERAWQAALAYARERRQGRNAAGGGPAAADPIIGHPDVRRMLLTQKSLIEPARVLTYFAGMQMDRALHHPDAAERERGEGLLAILTPIVKGFVTEMSLECTSLGIQVHGGHGYVRETGVEQYFRDARITAIYEGTNGVQAMDLLGRKVLGSGGALARLLGGLIGGFCERHAGSAQLSEFVTRLAGLLKEWSEATEQVAKRAARDPDETGAAAMDYLMLTGYLCLAWCWVRMAAVSGAALARGGEGRDFHEAKLATARFFFERILPRAEAHLDALSAGAGSVMELPGDRFAF